MENNDTCPNCGSHLVVPVRKNYDGGLGCLGLILFGWWGLLLGLLGGGDIEMYCQHCGARWSPQGRGCGCIGALVSALITFIVIGVIIQLIIAVLASL